MKNLINSLRMAARKRAQYRQTRDEIRYMPLDIALDLNIYRGDAERIAYKMVYGR